MKKLIIIIFLDERKIENEHFTKNNGIDLNRIKIENENFSKINGIDLSRIKDPQLDFIGQNKKQKSPICIRREGKKIIICYSRNA